MFMATCRGDTLATCRKQSIDLFQSGFPCQFPPAGVHPNADSNNPTLKVQRELPEKQSR